MRYLTQLSDLKFFFSVLLGSVAAQWTIIELLDYFGFGFEYFKQIRLVSIYLIFLHAVIISLIGLFIKRMSIVSQDEKLKDSLLVPTLENYIENLHSDGKYEEVIRFGSSLNFPLFFSGNYQARLNIGTMVEESAAILGDKYIQMSSLIDPVGWTLVELGKLDDGEDAINHGYEIAEQIGNEFFKATAKRHLGAINRRKKNFDEAESLYLDSLEISKKIKDKKQRLEIRAFANYALASFNFHLNEPDSGIVFIDSAIHDFEANGDRLNLMRAISKKGNIKFTQGSLHESKDLFRKSLQISRDISNPLETVRSLIGLSKICVEEKKWDEAKNCLQEAKSIEQTINRAIEMEEIDQLLSELQ